MSPEKDSPPMRRDKTKPLSELALIIAQLKNQGKRIAQCHGVFDLLHPGHIRHLSAAKDQGDILVVTITQDQYVNKGPGRPVFTERLRAETLAALQDVDFVAINRWPTAVETIQLLRPDVYVKGSDYSNHKDDITGKISEEEAAVVEIGGRIHFTDEITFSSSNLINTQLDVFPPDVMEWLKKFRSIHSIQEITDWLDKIIGKRVLVVGEAIIDEYMFCEALGKAAKDPVLAFIERSLESQAGGSLAIANHLAGLGAKASLLTLLGETERREEFLKKRLNPTVDAHFVTQTGAPTIRKRRYVDNATGVRVFETYLMNETPLTDDSEVAFLEKIQLLLPTCDYVLVADYGHSLFTPKIIEKLCEQSKYLAVNTQTNAGNRGFNTISKYSRADYVCLNGQELALEIRQRHIAQRELVPELLERIKCKRVLVTQGTQGVMAYTPEDGLVTSPALATSVKDRVGAGDALYAVTTMLSASGAPLDITGFIGNLAGAQTVGDLGNRVTLDRIALVKHSISLLK